MIQLNTLVRHPTGYDSPSVPESLCSPGALADLLIDARAWRKEAFLSDGAPSEAAAPLSDDAVRKLIDLAFYTSLVPEEGRHPRFKLVSQKFRSPLTVTRFEPVPLDVSSLHRLAPACTRPDCALLASERQNELYCEGVVCVGGLAYAVVPGQLGILAGGRTAEMLIEVFGPGHFRATEVYPGYEYRAGRVRALTGFDAPPAAESSVGDIQERDSGSLGTREGRRDSRAAIDVRSAVLYVLARMLRITVEARHGGAFIFLPPGTDGPKSCGLRVLHSTTDLHLGEDLADLLDKCEACRNTQARKSSIEKAEQSRARLLTDAEMVANFSMVDGCVTVDPIV
jgi:hypothetical protein